MRLTVALLTFLLVVPAFAAQHAALPTLTAPEGDDGSVTLTLESLSVHVLLRGHLARTTYELTNCARNSTLRLHCCPSTADHTIIRWTKSAQLCPFSFLKARAICHCYAFRFAFADIANMKKEGRAAKAGCPLSAVTRAE